MNTPVRTGTFHLANKIVYTFRRILHRKRFADNVAIPIAKHCYMMLFGIIHCYAQYFSIIIRIFGVIWI
ncbi:MAG: hypothetical protein KKC20_08730, partial [Proteobacteria bacterium]|nr:hypothetical protein [Pseudomonadota bacterium]